MVPESKNVPQCFGSEHKSLPDELIPASSSLRSETCAPNPRGVKAMSSAPLNQHRLTEICTTLGRKYRYSRYSTAWNSEFIPSPACKGGAVVQTMRAKLPAHVHRISAKVTALPEKKASRQ